MTKVYCFSATGRTLRLAFLRIGGTSYPEKDGATRLPNGRGRFSCLLSKRSAPRQKMFAVDCCRKYGFDCRIRTQILRKRPA